MDRSGTKRISKDNTHLGVYPKVVKTYVHIKTFTQMFTASLFIIAKTWKHLRSPSVDEQINKLWYTQTMKYYSVLRKKKKAIKP